MHVENYIEISRCVENVYVRHVENRVENCVEIRKNHHHSLRCVLSGRGPKIRRQTTRFDSKFTCVTEVRHIYFVVEMLLFDNNWGQYQFLDFFVSSATAKKFIWWWPNFPPLICICKQIRKLGQPPLKR